MGLINRIEGFTPRIDYGANIDIGGGGDLILCARIGRIYFLNAFRVDGTNMFSDVTVTDKNENGADVQRGDDKNIIPLPPEEQTTVTIGNRKGTITGTGREGVTVNGYPIRKGQSHIVQ